MRDFDVRQQLHTYLKGAHRDEPDTRVLDELGICQGDVRMDVAVVNGALGGYEIKSDRDNLGRLPVQIAHYSSVLDYAVLVVGERHLDHALSLLPSWWGVMTAHAGAEASVALTIRKPPQDNPSIDPERLVQLLWRGEALAALEDRRLAVGLRSKPRSLLWGRLTECLTVDELRSLVRQSLKARSGWRLA